MQISKKTISIYIIKDNKRTFFATHAKVEQRVGQWRFLNQSVSTYYGGQKISERKDINS